MHIKKSCQWKKGNKKTLTHASAVTTGVHVHVHTSQTLCFQFKNSVWQEKAVLKQVCLWFKCNWKDNANQAKCSLWTAVCTAPLISIGFCWAVVDVSHSKTEGMLNWLAFLASDKSWNNRLRWIGPLGHF